MKVLTCNLHPTIVKQNNLEIVNSIITENGTLFLIVKFSFAEINVFNSKGMGFMCK